MDAGDIVSKDEKRCYLGVATKQLASLDTAS